MGLIYMLTFASGKSYIGMTTKSMNARMNSHKAMLGIGRPSVLYNAWRKHGEPALEILLEAPNEQLPDLEVLEIAKRQTLYPLGYNSTPGGEKSPMLIPEIVAKLRGIKRSPETIERIRLSKIGKKASPETRAAMSIAQQHRRLHER